MARGWVGLWGNLPVQDQSEIARERLLHVSGRDGMSLLRECRLEFLFFYMFIHAVIFSRNWHDLGL